MLTKEDHEMTIKQCQEALPLLHKVLSVNPPKSEKMLIESLIHMTKCTELRSMECLAYIEAGENLTKH